MQGTAAAGGLIVLAMTVLASADNLVLLLTPEIGLWQFQVMRSSLAGTLLVVAALVMGWRLRPRSWSGVALRSIASSVAMLGYFGALSAISINQAAAGLFTAPIFVLLISVLGFGLRVGPVRWLAVVAGFAGVVVILRPWSGELALWAAGLAVAAGMFHGLSAVLTRQLCAREGTVCVAVGFFTAMTLWGLVGLGALGLAGVATQPPGPEGWFLRSWVAPSPQVLGLIAVQAVGSLLGIALVVRGYQMAEASRVTVFEYAFLPAAALVAWLLHAERPDPASLLGAALIVLAGATILLRSAPATPESLPAAAPLPATAPDAAMPPAGDAPRPGAGHPRGR